MPGGQVGAFDVIGGILAGRDPINPAHRRGLAGVVSGLSRQGDTAPPSPPGRHRHRYSRT